MSKWTGQQRLGLAMVLIALFLLFARGQGCSLPSIGPSDPPLIVLVYEADHGEPPPYAAGAVNELRKNGRQVRMIDDDAATGLDTVPEEVAAAIEPGRKIMGGTDGKGHALVLLSGERVVSAIPLPASKEAILEACQ